jgi:transcriptional regulator with XRE-family HTH domain
MYKNKFTPDGAQKTYHNIAGQNVIVLRKQKGWSQNGLACELQKLGHDVGKNAIQEMEAGKRFITDIELKGLATVLGVSYDRLMDESIYDRSSESETQADIAASKKTPYLK